jgi:hypothetical protein
MYCSQLDVIKKVLNRGFARRHRGQGQKAWTADSHFLHVPMMRDWDDNPEEACSSTEIRANLRLRLFRLLAVRDDLAENQVDGIERLLGGEVVIVDYDAERNVIATLRGRVTREGINVTQ